MNTKEIIFEKLTVDEEEKVNGGNSPDIYLCYDYDPSPPDKDC